MSLKSNLIIVLSFFVIACTTKPIVVEYAAADNYILKADLFLPEKKTATPLPLVIVIHGGGWSNRSGDMEDLCHKLSRAGFAALNITYRFAPLSCHPVQLNDVKAVFPWLKSHAEKYNLDKNQISIWGYSAGAHLAFLLGNQKDLGLNVKSVIVGGIPSYFPAYPNSPLVKMIV
ncbi:MAG: alpha/beta hydrolase [Bdellovibrionota bacterium]